MSHRTEIYRTLKISERLVQCLCCFSIKIVVYINYEGKQPKYHMLFQNSLCNLSSSFLIGARCEVSVRCIGARCEVSVRRIRARCEVSVRCIGARCEVSVRCIGATCYRSVRCIGATRYGSVHCIGTTCDVSVRCITGFAYCEEIIFGR